MNLLKFIQKYLLEIILGLVVVQGIVIGFYNFQIKQITTGLSNVAVPAASILATSSFVYSFNVPGQLQETGKMAESPSAYWWVNSGGFMDFGNGVGKTIEGGLPTFSFWRILYSKTNPTDTDNGYHPQNIFRLVTRSKWGNSAVESSFKIDALNLSNSPNRNESNGLLLFSRYENSDNLYYAGIRVDGHAVIKKKINGEYFTLQEKSLIPGPIYNRDKNPTLLAQDKWINLKMETSEKGPSLTIKLLINGEEVLEATDDGSSYGGPAFLGPNYAGIRTDFMDVEFKDFEITSV